jgi:hypothetical protein
VPTVLEAGWAPEPDWAHRLGANSSASVGDRTPAVQSVVRHCTVGAGGSFPGGKARPGRDADHSPPSSAGVKKQ